MSFTKNLLVALAAAPILSANAAVIHRRGAKPELPYDPNTTKDCTWWTDYDGSADCATMLENEFATLSDFRRWNPTIGENCAGLTAGKSYCVEALIEQLPGPSTSAVPSPSPSQSSSVISSVKVSQSPSPSSSSTVVTTPKVTPTPMPTPKPSSSSPSPSPTKPAGNGIETPLPTQPNLVSNCDEFYLVQSGDQCAAIAQKFGITLAKFQAWNPNVGSTCGGLWADAYACVSIVGEKASPVATPTPTPTKGNGIQTPQPTQPNMVSNCDKFYLVVSGDTCANIAAKNGISTAQFSTWNPNVGSNCGGLWADTYACISIVGHEPTKVVTPTPTPTQNPGGVTTPQPTQPGMVSGCKKFDFVKSGDTCDVIAKRNNISTANFIKWNTGVGSTCTSMWASVNVCVGV